MQGQFLIGVQPMRRPVALISVVSSTLLSLVTSQLYWALVDVDVLDNHSELKLQFTGLIVLPHEWAAAVHCGVCMWCYFAVCLSLFLLPLANMRCDGCADLCACKHDE